MDKGIRNTLFWTLGFVALVLILFVSSFVGSRQLTEEQLRELGYFNLPEAQALEEFSLVNSEGNEVGLESLKGQWSLLFFGFTHCPDVCPTTLSVLNRAVNQMDNSPQVVMVSVDPDRDTPELMGQYVQGFNPNFVGYTGTFDETVNLADQVNIGFAKMPGDEPGTYLVEHSTSIVVVDDKANYKGFIKPPHQSEDIASIVTAIR
ncbi:MAG: SCO family protein [Pseudomonadales bacterium]